MYFFASGASTAHKGCWRDSFTVEKLLLVSVSFHYPANEGCGPVPHTMPLDEGRLGKPETGGERQASAGSLSRACTAQQHYVPNGQESHGAGQIATAGQRLPYASEQ